MFKFPDRPCSCDPRPRFDVVAKLGARCHSYRRDYLVPWHEPILIEWWFRYWCPWCGGMAEVTFDTWDNHGPRWLPSPEVLRFDDQWRLVWAG